MPQKTFGAKFFVQPVNTRIWEGAVGASAPPKINQGYSATFT